MNHLKKCGKGRNRTIVDLASIDFVEQLADDEGVEKNGEVLDGIVLNSPEVWELVQETKVDNKLEDGLTNDGFPHGASNQAFPVLSVARKWESSKERIKHKNVNQWES